MNKFITALAAVALFGASVASANTTNMIENYVESTPKVEEPAVTNAAEAAKAEFIKLTEEVTKNAREVRALGGNWAIAHTENQRLRMLQQRAEVRSKTFESRIQDIVKKQVALTTRSIELVQELQMSMSPEAFEKLRMEFIVPKAIELETMKQTSLNFMKSIETSHQRVANNPEMLTVENHIALTKYDKKQLEKFLELSDSSN